MKIEIGFIGFSRSIDKTYRLISNNILITSLQNRFNYKE